MTVHGSVVAVGRSAVLILGGSGTGKSGLALRLMALGARLVADDRVELARATGADGRPVLEARAPARIAGKIEARGVGILDVGPGPVAEIRLAVDLDRSPEARMPQPRTITYHDVAVQLISGRDVPNIDAVLTVLLHKQAVPE
jgi:HPr kinase/phosphorylase